VALADIAGPLRAVVWVQWRASRNAYLRSHKSSVAVQWIMSLLWYGSWVLAAAGVGFLASGRIPMPFLEKVLPGGLFLIFFFWQVLPIMLASQGAILDLRRLLSYPIPSDQLFLLEIALRFTTAIEMALLCAGLVTGLVLNPEVPFWGPLAVLAFMLFNLLLAAGLKSLIQRLFRLRGVRELAILIFVAIVMIPQFLALSDTGSTPAAPMPLRGFGEVFRFSPWAATAGLALGHVSILAVGALFGSIGAAYLFARFEFARALRLDEGTGGAKPNTDRSIVSRWDGLTSWPARILPDPLAALVQKDLRTLTRSPRFRLLFVMSGTFGALFWLPQVLRSSDSWLARNYVTMAALYGMLLLGEVLYWNVFGFERSSVQQWFVTPVRIHDVLRAKNLVAGFATALAISLLCAVSAVLPIGVNRSQYADAAMAAAVFLVCVLGAGNLTSVYIPRPIDPGEAWRNNASKTQFLLLLAFPLFSTPIALAYLARWATDNYWAFHAVLGFAMIAAVCFYLAATEAAAEAATIRKEEIVAALSQKEGPISLNT
jgi:ABC-2 type transport system permease protein